MKFRFFIFILLCVAACVVVPCARASALVDGRDYEGRLITAIEVALEDAPADESAQAELRSLLVVAPNTEYSAVLVRRSLQALFDSGLVAAARVEVLAAGGGSVAAGANGAGQNSGAIRLRFIIKRQARVGEVKVAIDAGGRTDQPVSEDELRARLNMLEPGARVSEQTLRRNADEIQAFVRDRGFFRATVDFTQQLDAGATRSLVTFNVKLSEEARVAAFNINVTGFEPTRVRPSLKLQTNAPFTRQALGEDINRIRQAIIAQGFLAPRLDDPQVVLDSEKNLITVNLTGGIGPKVDVKVVGYDVKDKTALNLLPVKREGNIDQSAIIEGRRRLQNKLQENGFFFAEATPVCTVTPPVASTTNNGTEETCNTLNPDELSGHTVQITYNVDTGRRFKLTDIRIEGTKQLTPEDVEDDLRTQKANALGFIPLLGYGRGYTSRELLLQDIRTLRARMADLGYRKAKVSVRQGVSIAGEGLIITFVVDEGALTRVAGVEIRGNQIFTASRLREEIDSPECRDRLKPKNADLTANNTQREAFKTVVGAPFSRSSARVEGDCLLDLYARNGYIDAQLDFSIIELPKHGDDEQVRLVYTIGNEGDKVFINRVVVNGLIRTKQIAILQALPLAEGDILRADKLTESERILYATDAFRQVIIRTERAGDTAAGFKKRDVVIDLEELKPRVANYGFGYSTDDGPRVFADVRNVNLFGKLRVGAIRTRYSSRQQLLRFEYFDPRFQRYGQKQFAPLTLSLQYQRDSTITRFFRSTIDKGNFGIVQRLDEDGKPVDELGTRTSEPTINRFTFNAETQRSFGKNLRNILFLRYSYEDVRLFNLSSLLIAPILRPDRAIRLSRFGASFARDTRDSTFEPTRGDFLTFDYSLALRQLGGNLSFNKVQASYRRYYKLEGFRNTILAGNVTLGLANLFNPRDRDGDGIITDVDRTLPISERFFSGGSTTLRGFAYEEAGPRVVIPCGITNDAQGRPIGPDPCGTLRNSKGEIVKLNPFLVPIGGNALAIVNLEARIPLNKIFQAVPFYDGGNVFRRTSDIFGRNTQPGDDPRLRAQWSNTVGLGFRVKTPIGGSLAVDYGFLLRPPEFQIPQNGFPDATIRLKRSQVHFRFTQAF